MEYRKRHRKGHTANPPGLRRKHAMEYRRLYQCRIQYHLAFYEGRKNKQVNEYTSSDPPGPRRRPEKHATE
jgi:hypothetical protein